MKNTSIKFIFSKVTDSKNEFICTYFLRLLLKGFGFFFFMTFSRAISVNWNCYYSPVAKGVWYDKLGGNLPPIWMSTIMSNVPKKFGCQEKFLLWMCILQTRITTDQVFLCSYWNQVICYELAHKIKTTCQINMKFGQNVPRKWN